MIRPAACLIVLMLLFIGADPVIAESQDVFERVLIPVAGKSRVGSFGSIWTTEFQARNLGSETVVFFVGSGNCNIGNCPKFYLDPKTTSAPETHLEGSGGRDGNLGYADRSRAHDLVFAARVRDLSREAFDHGTELPVVRESELLRGPTSLLAIPTSDRYRVAIRGYTVRPGEQRLRLEVHPLNRDLVLADARLRMSLVETGSLPRFPGYDQILDLFAAFPAARSEPVVRIDVIPETDQPYWVMVSMTNNETQRVTLVTPQ